MSEGVLLLGAGASFGDRVGIGRRTNDERIQPLDRGLAEYPVRRLRANDETR